MKKSDKNESVSKHLFFIKKGLNDLKDENNHEKIESIASNIRKLLIIYNGMRRLILILLVAVVVLAGGLLTSISYNSEVKTFNEEIIDLRDDSIVREILNIKEIDNGDSIRTSYNYLTRNNKILTYKTLSNENDSLGLIIENKKKQISKLDDEKAELKSKLNLVLKGYNITITSSKDSITAESKQIDSALVLLEVFRHKMTYDKTTKKWTIKQ